MGIFSTEHMKKLLHNKFVLLIGDSVQRSIYKDLVVLWHENRFIKDKELRTKGETSFLGDKLVERSELTNGIEYREVREFKSDHILIRFYFATRIYNNYIESVLKKLEDVNEFTPDVVLLNSCLWDISRYGKKGWDEYQKNLEKFCSRLDDIVPAETCIIWRTTLPVSQKARGGFLSGKVARNNESLVVDVLLANYLAYTVVEQHKYDVIDMHFMFTEQLQRRATDGIHWNMFAHRRMTNIILTHVSKAWGLGVPHHSVIDDFEPDLKQKDISMNTTDVLQRAYPSVVALRQSSQPSPEQRYGGPIRSTEEMFNYYTNFYQRTPLLSAPVSNVNSHLVKRSPMFKLDPTPRSVRASEVKAYDNYWTRDDPFVAQQMNSRKVELIQPISGNWNINLDFHQRSPLQSNWNENNQFHPKSKKNQRRKRGSKPYNRRVPHV